MLYHNLNLLSLLDFMFYIISCVIHFHGLYLFNVCIIQVKVYPHNINDSEFADALVDSFLEISGKNLMAFSSAHRVSCERHEDSVSNIYSSSHGTICYSPSNFPDARPGYIIITFPNKILHWLNEFIFI